MDASAYVRVSSKSQDLGMQRAAIERAATARGDTIKIWYEEKRSAKTMARPELDRLRSDLRTGVGSGRLYTFKLDRLTRTGVADTYKIIGEIKGAGRELIAVADNLKPGAEDIVSDVFLFALGLAARLERQAINDRIAAARDRIEGQGRRWGRPRRLDDEAVARIQGLRNAGRTIRDISIALKIPRSTVADALALSGKDAGGSGTATPLAG